jgi:hypothetical protein
MGVDGAPLSVRAPLDLALKEADQVNKDGVRHGCSVVNRIVPFVQFEALEAGLDRLDGRRTERKDPQVLLCGPEPEQGTTRTDERRHVVRHAAKAPRGEIRRCPVGHFDIYIGELFERVVADQLAFLHTRVPTAATN